ncbi:WXG100 family type VII secretion target [Nocardia coffeae]|uniref:WXG100 family type VII secretion target n=1 Tax=Nocardia coffeae TaxID=2873381 RepID=UPI001F26D304|nr:WXG100 family type VII secretion target [Nocardia coffeae]
MFGEDVAAIGRYVYGAAENLRSALSAVNREVDALASGTWTGTAATTFGQGWDECQDGGGKIIDALTAMAEKLGVTATNFHAQDTRTSTAISSLDLP